MEIDFACISYNVKGLRRTNKRIKIFNYLKEKLKKGVLLLQETHSTNDDLEAWSNEMGYKILLNNGTSNSRGTLIGISKNFEYKILHYYDDKQGRLQLLALEHNDQKFLIVNIYNENIEKDQVLLLKNLNEQLEKIEDIINFQIVIGGDWNFVLDKQLDTFGGNPSLKMSSISELTKIMTNFDLCDIYRLRNPDTRRFTYRQNSPKRLRRLDYFILSNSIQEIVQKTEVLTSVSSDHSPVLVSFNSSPENTTGSAYWKFNSLLLKNPAFLDQMAKEIEILKNSLQNFPPQEKWELMKYKIRAFCIKFSKNRAKEKREIFTNLEQQIKAHENAPSPESSDNYLASKLEFERLLNEKTNGCILRSKTTIFEQNEKSSKYFLSLEKKNAVQNTIKLLLDNSIEQKEITDPKQIANQIKVFYSSLFSRKSQMSAEDCQKFLKNLTLPKVSHELNEMLKKPLTILELEEAIKNSQNGKSPGNDGITREFYIVFWKQISQPLFESLIDGKNKGFLSASQRQAVIKLLEKKSRDKRLIINWRPISLINFDTKLLSKVLAERLKKVLPTLIKHDQTAYVSGRFLGESVRLISDILDITKTLNIEGYLMTIDIEKAFDSVDHPFLIAVLNVMGFDSEFIKWIKVLINRQESCVINGGASSGYFELERGSRQGDPISAYLFILVMEVFFTMIRSNPKIEGLDILGFTYLLTSYADDTTFFIKNESSAIEIFKTFEFFSKYSGLKVNKSKCEIAGIGVKHGVHTALLGTKNVNLNSNYIKILGVNFTYNQQIYLEKNFIEVVEKIEKVLSIWRWRNLSLSGKITVFKSLAFSKIIFISYLNDVPVTIIKKIEQIQKDFIWNGKKPKIKHTTLINDYEEGGLKDIDIESKFSSLHMSWIRRLFDKNFHPWKNIPLKLFNNTFEQEIFYPNVQITLDKRFPNFYHKIAKGWSGLTQEPLTANSALMQQVWYNKFIIVNKKPITKMFPCQLFIVDLFHQNELLEWQNFKEKLNLSQKYYFRWRQIVAAIPKSWKKMIAENNTFSEISKIQHTIQITRAIPLEKLTSKYLYMLKIYRIKKPPSSQSKLIEKLNEENLNWNEIYTLGRKSSIDNYCRMFHFKCMHNILYLNDKLFKMNLAPSKTCSYCSVHDETVIHLFSACIHTLNTWNLLRNKTKLTLPVLTPKSAFFGFHEVDDKLINHIHLIFKIAIYKNRNKNICSANYVINKIIQIKKIEQNITYLNQVASDTNKRKWARLENIL